MHTSNQSHRKQPASLNYILQTVELSCSDQNIKQPVFAISWRDEWSTFYLMMDTVLKTTDVCEGSEIYWQLRITQDSTKLKSDQVCQWWCKSQSNHFGTQISDQIHSTIFSRPEPSVFYSPSQASRLPHVFLYPCSRIGTSHFVTTRLYPIGYCFYFLLLWCQLMHFHHWQLWSMLQPVGALKGHVYSWVHFLQKANWLCAMYILSRIESITFHKQMAPDFPFKW